MWGLLKAAAALGVAVSVVLGADGAPPANVEVKVLPGWDGPLPSKWFTGYLNGGKKADGKQLWYHYTLVLSEGDPATDPLILWTNGGPGASSNFGLFTELGPFFLSGASTKTAAFNKTGVPTLFRNPYSWSKLGTLLVLNGPPPVSYSYCDPPGPAGSGFDCGKWDDQSTAEANYQFLESFYGAHPEFAGNDLFLTGESYAGIYLRTLLREILKRDASASFSRRALKGVAIGDGCVGTEIVCSGASGGGLAPREGFFKAKFLYGHHQMSTPLYNRIEKACTDPAAAQESECADLMKEMDKQVGYYFDYNLYDECWDDANLPTASTEEAAKRRAGLGRGGALQQQSRRLEALGGALNDYPCGGGAALSTWMQHSAVREAFAVGKDAMFVSGDNSASLDYELTEKNLLPFQRKVALETDVRMLIYNGDTDPALNSFIAEWWISELKLAEKEGWRPWTLDGKKEVVGYVTTYEGDFSFVTIRGSGHMVPQMKPAASFEMLRSWLANEPLKGYKA